MKINEIKDLLQADSVAQATLAKLAKDDRKGVQKLLASYQRRQEKLAKQKEEFMSRFSYEKDFWAKGQLVAGVDEVGRGPLAGPVVAAAVVLPEDFSLLEVNDSKKLSPQKRLALYPKILEQAVAVGVGVMDNKVIDQINIYEADRQAMKQAVEALSTRPDALLVDAMNVPVDLPQVELIKGDAKSNSIAAASIVAKVFRDSLMDDYARLYPDYAFDHNLEALRKYGPTPIHRLTFSPVSEMVGLKKAD
ncbi:ribonuclease HII [uncultured Lactobacillus sp.]|uniref:ribonuclease HII n=1 Tax=uncultured Lactobacillus sp. TaxID=153152 RepID=UPI002619D311|nr:ribonuclease HII [uncultured Lactobacillus sp.]